MKQGIRIIKPDVVAHCNPDKEKTRNAIYSCDIQKGGDRIATGGGDSFVKIWKLSSLLATPEICDDALQASLCNHTKSVNVVRWSCDGQFLASGSDDCYILVYKLDTSGGNISSQPFGSNAIQNKESWSRCLTLHGHTMDVLDLDWSPKGYIASASIDNKIIIWDLTSHFANPQGTSLAMVANPYRVLDSHKSFVKGISFDPVGSFLASSSADNEVILWNMDTWEIVTTLKEPMADSTDRTIFRRISWAPDGGSLCLSSATKAAKPVGMVLKRDSWESLADLVGHEAQSTCCRFCPYIKVAEKQKKRQDADGKPRKKYVPCTICALGDHQGVVSVWSTVLDIPLLVLKEIFTGPVLDITWTSLEGNLAENCPSQVMTARSGEPSTSTTDLMACSSLDGSLVLVMFDSGSLSGKFERIMSHEEQESHFKKLYGRAQSQILETPEPLLEGPSVLKYRDASESNNISNINSHQQSNIRNGNHDQNIPPSKNDLPKSNGQPIFQPQQKQRVSISKTGKKRIQPVLLNNPLSVSPNNGHSFHNNSIAFNSAQSRNTHSEASNLKFDDVQFDHDVASTKRLKVSNTDITLSDSNKSSIEAGSFRSLTFHQNSFICRSAPMRKVSGEDSFVSGEVKFDDGNIPKARSGLSSLLSNLNSKKTITSLRAKYVKSPSLVGRAKTFNTSLSHVTAFTNPTNHEEDGSDTSDMAIAWDAYLHGEVTAILGLQSRMTESMTPISSEPDGLCVAGTNDGAIHLLSLQSGMRLSPIFIVGAPVIAVDLLKFGKAIIRVLLVTADGNVLLYDYSECASSDTKTKLSFVCKASLRPLLVSMKCGMTSSDDATPLSNATIEEQDMEVQRAYLSGSGDVVVSVRTKKYILGGSWQSFQYSLHTQLWMRVADMRSFLSGVFMGVSTGGKNSYDLTEERPLDILNKEAIRENDLSMSDVLNVSRTSLNSSSSLGMESYTNKMTLSHIEERIATAFSLHSVAEARMWLAEWTSFCCNHNLQKKVKWVVNRLVLGFNGVPRSGSIRTTSWDWLDTGYSDVQGVLKMDILKDTILPAISRSDTSQSLLIEITDVLDSLSSEMP